MTDPYHHRDWPRYAKALDMHLDGRTLDEIAAAIGGVSRERARQIVLDAKAVLAFRVFRIKRPLLGSERRREAELERQWRDANLVLERRIEMRQRKCCLERG